MNETQRLRRNEYMRAYQGPWRLRMTPDQLERYRVQRRANQAAHPETCRMKSKRFRDKIRALTLAAYGGACVCCGEDESVFLTLDHVVPIRSKKRPSSHQLYMKLRKESYPAGYQLLCFNCNAAKRTNESCPHAGLIKEKTNMNSLRLIEASPPYGVTA